MEQHGGIYIDAGTLLLRDLDDICWAALEDPSSPYTVAFMAQQMKDHFGQVLNGFIAARKHNEFIHRCGSCFRSPSPRKLHQLTFVTQTRAASLSPHVDRP